MQHACNAYFIVDIQLKISTHSNPTLVLLSSSVASAEDSFDYRTFFDKSTLITDRLVQQKFKGIICVLRGKLLNEERLRRMWVQCGIAASSFMVSIESISYAPWYVLARISEAITGRCPATNVVIRVGLKKRLASEDKRRYLECMSMEPKQARIAAILKKTYFKIYFQLYLHPRLLF